MADAGRRERGRKVTIDQVPKPDQDPRREPGLGFREDPGERVGGATSQFLEATARIVGRGSDVEGPRRQRPGGPDPEEVRAIGRVGPRPDRAGHDHAVAGDDDRVAGKRRGDTERSIGIGRSGERGGLSPVAWGPGRLDDERPRPVTVGRDIEGRRPGGDHGQSDGDQAGPKRDGEQGANARMRPDLPDEKDAGQAERDRRAEMARCDLPGGHCRDDGSESEPAAATHPQRTVTRSLKPSNVFWPTSFRVRRSSTALNG